MIHEIHDRYIRDSVVDRALLVKRRSSLWLRKGVVFIHVPKAAGTSISEALYGRATGHIRASDVIRWGSSAVKSLPRVAVVRNPWDRLVSAYRFIKRGGGIGGLNPAGVRCPEQYKIAEFSNFHGFVNEWLVEQDIQKLDGVFQPQFQFVSYHGQIVVSHLGRVESLDRTHEYLAAHVSSLRPFGRSNRSGDPVDYRGFYTSQLIDRVREIYADDVRLFDYHFDDAPRWLAM